VKYFKGGASYESFGTSVLAPVSPFVTFGHLPDPFVIDIEYIKR
jgi:hypothetical protein